MSAGRALDYAVVFLMAALGDLVRGPLLGLILLAVGIGFLVLWNRKRRVMPDEEPLALWPRDTAMPSSSVIIQLIRDGYRYRRGE